MQRYSVSPFRKKAGDDISNTMAAATGDQSCWSIRKLIGHGWSSLLGGIEEQSGQNSSDQFASYSAR